MKQEELRQLFNVFINNDVVTDLSLQLGGFNKNMIQRCLNEGIITKLGNIYILKRTNLKELKLYGITLIQVNDDLKALKCFNLCLKLNPEHDTVKFYRLITLIKTKNYEGAIEYFNDKTIDKWTELDRFYLYLLSLLTTLPEEYQRLCAVYRESVLEERIDLSKDPYGEVKTTVAKYKFNTALKLAKRIYTDNRKITPQNYLIQTLIGQIKKSINLNTIHNLLKQNQIEDALALLREYLLTKNKLEYIELIRLSIRLSSFSDKDYELPMSILTNIENGEEIKIDIKELADRFDDAERKGIYYEAHSIVRILNEIDYLGIRSINIDEYSRRLDKIC